MLEGINGKHACYWLAHWTRGSPPVSSSIGSSRRPPLVRTSGVSRLTSSSRMFLSNVSRGLRGGSACSSSGIARRSMESGKTTLSLTYISPGSWCRCEGMPCPCMTFNSPDRRYCQCEKYDVSINLDIPCFTTSPGSRLTTRARSSKCLIANAPPARAVRRSMSTSVIKSLS